MMDHTIISIKKYKQDKAIYDEINYIEWEKEYGISQTTLVVKINTIDHIKRFIPDIDGKPTEYHVFDTIINATTNPWGCSSEPTEIKIKYTAHNRDEHLECVEKIQPQQILIVEGSLFFGRTKPNGAMMLVKQFKSLPSELKNIASNYLNS